MAIVSEPSSIRWAASVPTSKVATGIFRLFSWMYFAAGFAPGLPSPTTPQIVVSAWSAALMSGLRLDLVRVGREIGVLVAGRVERALHAVGPERQHECVRERVDDQDGAIARRKHGGNAWPSISPEVLSSWPTKASSMMRGSLGAFSPSKRLLL